jgi:16S rRNA C1402 (ribose-2'-O) methylase RsmI
MDPLAQQLFILWESVKANTLSSVAEQMDTTFLQKGPIVLVILEALCTYLLSGLTRLVQP